MLERLAIVIFGVLVLLQPACNEEMTQARAEGICGEYEQRDPGCFTGVARSACVQCQLDCPVCTYVKGCAPEFRCDQHAPDTDDDDDW